MTLIRTDKGLPFLNYFPGYNPGTCEINLEASFKRDLKKGKVK
jgi:hypothetical protein